MRTSVGSIRHSAKQFMRSTAGISAVEFALIVPILALMLLAMLEVGNAIHNRMALDSVLRAGAQEAMNPQAERPDIETAMEDAPGPAGREHIVRTFRACPEDFVVGGNPLSTSGPESCNGDSSEPYRFYELEVEFEHEFLVLPDGILRLPLVRDTDLGDLQNLTTRMLVQQPSQ